MTNTQNKFDQGFAEFLKHAATSHDDYLARATAEIINASFSEKPSEFLRNLQKSGCASGMVPGLISRTEVHDFFDENYEGIEYLRQEHEEPGHSVELSRDLKTCLAWWAFELTAFGLATEFGLEL